MTPKEGVTPEARLAQKERELSLVLEMDRIRDEHSRNPETLLVALTEMIVETLSAAAPVDLAAPQTPARPWPCVADSGAEPRVVTSLASSLRQVPSRGFVRYNAVCPWRIATSTDNAGTPCSYSEFVWSFDTAPMASAPDQPDNGSDPSVRHSGTGPDQSTSSPSPPCHAHRRLPGPAG